MLDLFDAKIRFVSLAAVLGCKTLILQGFRVSDLFDRKVRFVLSGSVPSQETVLSQQLRVAHRFETAQRTPSGSLSASVCSQQATCRVFPDLKTDPPSLRAHRR